MSRMKHHAAPALLIIALCSAMLTALSVAADFDPSHFRFDGVLKQYVKEARVNYVALKTHPDELNRYLDQIAAVRRAELESWDEKRQLAFLVNAYNAWTLRLIIDHYPLGSIKDIGNLIRGPWDQPVVHLFGETTDLNTLEHKFIRENHSEPRIHFALVCAAKGCPPLRSEAYVGARLEEQLVDQAKRFLSDRAKNRIDQAGRIVYLSPIFKWYGGDFEKKSGSVLEAIQPYWPGGSHRTDGFKIRFTDYDWSLNEPDK